MSTLFEKYDIDVVEPGDDLNSEPEIFALIVEVSKEAEIRPVEEIPEDGPDEVDTSELYVRSEDYLNLLLEISAEYDFEGLFCEPDQMPDSLRKNGIGGYDSPRVYRSQLENNDMLQMTGLLALMLYDFRYDRTDELRGLLSEHQNIVSEFPSYLRLFFSSYIGYESTIDQKTTDFSDAIEDAYNAKEMGPPHSLIRANFAEAVIKACELRTDFVPQSDHVPSIPESDDETSRRTTAIEEAVEEARNVKRDDPNFIKVYSSLARGYALLGEFDDARSELQDAISREQYSESNVYFDEETHENLHRIINNRRRVNDLQTDIEDAKIDVENVDEDIDELEDSLESTVEEYRRNTLQFIGFFAALITLAVTSVQIIDETNTSIQGSGRLIAMLTGGMLMAFGGLGLILPAMGDMKHRIEWTVRTVLITGLGAGLLYVAYTGL